MTGLKWLSQHAVSCVFCFVFFVVFLNITASLVFIKRSGACVFMQVPETPPNDDEREIDVLFARFQLTGAYTLDDVTLYSC